MCVLGKFSSSLLSLCVTQVYDFLKRFAYFERVIRGLKGRRKGKEKNRKKKKRERTARERDESSICWFTPWMATVASPGPDGGQKPAASCESSK